MIPTQLRGGAAVRSLLFALTALATAAALIVPNVRAQPITEYCRVTVTVDYYLGVGYWAVLRMADDCGSTTVGRVRKINTRGHFSRPLLVPGGKPEHGGLWGWNMNDQTSFVPENEFWTASALGWRWQYFDGRSWQNMGPP